MKSSFPSISKQDIRWQHLESFPFPVTQHCTEISLFIHDEQNEWYVSKLGFENTMYKHCTTICYGLTGLDNKLLYPLAGDGVEAVDLKSYWPEYYKENMLQQRCPSL